MGQKNKSTTGITQNHHSFWVTQLKNYSKGQRGKIKKGIVSRKVDMPMTK
jgi:heme-binding NEAT domain protein